MFRFINERNLGHQNVMRSDGARFSEGERLRYWALAKAVETGVLSAPELEQEPAKRP